MARMFRSNSTTIRRSRSRPIEHREGWLKECHLADGSKLNVIHIKACRAQTPRLKRGSLGDPTRPLRATSMQPD